MKTTRKIVKIDEDKCDGCGECIPACVEGALKIVDGKARLVKDIYCDGLGACLGECPQDAITIEERLAEGFDEEAVEEYLAGQAVHEAPESAAAGAGRACPGTAAFSLGPACPCENEPAAAGREAPRAESALRNWPVQFDLVPPQAPYFQGADLLIAADCVPFAYAGFHRDFLENRALLIACPKLDDFPAHLAKLTAVLSQSDVKSITVLHMEVPCCSGLVHMARQAIQFSGKNVPLREVTVGVRGDLKS